MCATIAGTSIGCPIIVGATNRIIPEKATTPTKPPNAARK
jgi:hypothetical protein